MGATIGGIGGKTIGQGGVRGRVSVDPTPQGLSRPGKAICGPMTRSGLRTGCQNRRIDQAGRYGLVAGFLVLRALGVPGGGICKAGAHVGHQIAEGTQDGEDAMNVGIEVGKEAVRLGGIGSTPRTTSSRGRWIGGHVELGRIKLAGRGIVTIGAEQITPPSAFYRAAGIVVAIIVTVAVHQRSSPGSVHPRTVSCPGRG
ncbi:hypothetical protein I6G65_20345 (plasmid) [Sphingomonas paucimobilis]|uniref:hypothetical protein n=1 Tax=Sphingomonas paucimobilis TaxID=13689 RepID=UPI0018DA253E|nr:hypothetical protein [Sphingomonas paucimobilis]QPS18547.1 hypothetical protein I6G65_20345 [Sphingomonas paucimobilis]